MNTYHDVIDEGLGGIAFQASSIITCIKFLWWRWYNVDARAAYWLREFSGCSLERYILFEDVAECQRFKAHSGKFGISEELCIEVPEALYTEFENTRRAMIVRDLAASQDKLSILAEHFSTPEST